MAAVSALPPLIIVHDAGEDIDDTLALALAAISDRYSKIIVVSANDEDGTVAKYARKLLDELGRSDIETYRGEPGKLGNRTLIKLEGDEQPTGYVEAVGRLLETHERVHILGIAAMTPIAKLIKAHGADKFKICQMGGRLSDAEWPEYNMRCDPKAAQEVLESGAEIEFVLSDTTFQEGLGMDDTSELYKLVESKKGHPFFKSLLEGYTAFRQHRKYVPYTSDAVAFLADEFVTFREACVKIDAEGIMREAPDGRSVKVSTEIDKEAFIGALIRKLKEIDR